MKRIALISITICLLASQTLAFDLGTLWIGTIKEFFAYENKPTIRQITLEIEHVSGSQFVGQFIKGKERDEVNIMAGIILGNTVKAASKNCTYEGEISSDGKTMTLYGLQVYGPGTRIIKLRKAG